MGKDTIPAQIYCVGCGRMRKKEEFWMSHNENHEEHWNRMYYCKTCCSTKADNIFKKYGSYELACREMCSVFDMPYVSEAMLKLQSHEFDTTKVEKRNFSRVYQYGVFLKELGIPKEHWSNLSCNSFVKMDILKVAKGKNEGDDELFFELEKDWGRQDKLEYYLFLEEKFNTYTDGEKLTPSMINTIKYLCQAELDVVKLKESKTPDQKEIATAEKRVMDYYKILKLDEFKFESSKNEVEQLLENWAYIQENIEPLDWEDENLKDRLGIDKDYDDIMRALGNKVLNAQDYPTLTLEDVQKSEKKRKRK